MNYSQKRTLIGRIVYIGLTLMAVTVLCVTMFTFFGSSKESNKNKLPEITEQNKPSVTTQDITDEEPPVQSSEPDEEEKPTVVPPEKDWTDHVFTMPVSGTVMKGHDLTKAVYSATMNDYRVHKGIDIECELGSDVLCPAYGVVVSVGLDPFMGSTVTIDHGDGLISVYKNLNSELPDNIKAGKEIFEGEVIGVVGESAIIEIADEPHLHFELTLNGSPVDPLDFFDYKATVSSGEGEENSSK